MNDKKGNRAGTILKFVYPNPEDNKDFLSFLANDELGIGLRKSMLSDSFKNIQKALKTYESIQK